MRANLKKLSAFLLRDWRIMASYRFLIFFSLAHIVFSCTVFFFVSRLVDSRTAPSLDPYGGAYFPFILLGLAFSRYVATGLSSFSRALREEQLQGTLEAMLLSPTSPALIVIGGSLLDVLWTTLEVGVYLLIGTLFGLSLAQCNWLAALVVLVLTLFAMSSLGVLSACGVLLFKEFNPFATILGGAMRLFGGVYFPITLFPAWVGILPYLFPVTFGLEGMRQAVLNGASLSALRSECLALLVFIIVLWPLALWALHATIDHLKHTGRLSFR